MFTENSKLTGGSLRLKLALAATALVGAGALGAFAVGATRPSVEMAPLTRVAINGLAASDGVVTVKGQVADVYGNKFVMADASGKTLVDTGRAGEFAALVRSGQSVTVQGRFRHGFVQASFLVGADGKIVSLHPRGGRRDRDDRGRRGEDAPGGHGSWNDMPRQGGPVAAPDGAPAAPAPTEASPSK